MRLTARVGNGADPPTPLSTHSLECTHCAAGEGISLLPGSYTMPLSFSGILNFAQWGLRLLVRILLAGKRLIFLVSALSLL